MEFTAVGYGNGSLLDILQRQVDKFMEDWSTNSYEPWCLNGMAIFRGKRHSCFWSQLRDFLETLGWVKWMLNWKTDIWCALIYWHLVTIFNWKLPYSALWMTYESHIHKNLMFVVHKVQLTVFSVCSVSYMESIYTHSPSHFSIPY